MKTPVCCSILFFAATIVITAQGQGLTPQPMAAPQKITAQNSASVPIRSSSDFYTANETDKGCEYLRVYRVRRPYVNSDVTVRSGYTVCVPSWKTQVRSAVQTQSGPSIGK